MELKAGGEVPGSIHLTNGQEAIAVGVASVLRPDDYVTATYRGHGWAIARGSDLSALFAEVMARSGGINGGRAGSPYFSDASVNFLGENSIVGAGVPIAAGAALSARRHGRGQVSIAAIGDGATNQGAVHEALNLAAVLALPLVLIVENNVYSEMVRIADMTRVDRLAVRADGYGIPGVTIDGNDPGVVAAAVAAAVERARRGEGPTMIEAMTQRLVGHHSGDAQHYRPRGEVAEAALDEPLHRIRSAADAALSAELDAVDAAVADEIARAVEAARATDLPDPSTAKDHVYA
ncbi:thiamine pyrophosphate-dependent dehydrogenase E1 component subunit alpha [Microbacterium resistens]